MLHPFHKMCKRTDTAAVFAVLRRWLGLPLASVKVQLEVYESVSPGLKGRPVGKPLSPLLRDLLGFGAIYFGCEIS